MSDRSRMRAEAEPRFREPREPAYRPNANDVLAFEDTPLMIVPAHGEAPIATDSSFSGELRFHGDGSVQAIRLSCGHGRFWAVPVNHPLFDILATSIRIGLAHRIAAAVQELHTQREAA